jgi:hypothetical protein
MLLTEGIKDWKLGGLVDDEKDAVELEEREDNLDIFFEDSTPC